MSPDELEAWLRLTLTQGVGNGTARRLLSRFGLPQEVFRQTDSALAQCVTAVQARALRTVPATLAALLQTTSDWLSGADPQGPARAIVSLGDTRYPQSLLDTEDPPILLYVLGPYRLVNGQPFAGDRCLAVVGSRNPTAQGAENARFFARALHSAGLTIVSGLALGVDAAAHEGALEAAAGGTGTGTGAGIGEGEGEGAAGAAATIAVVGTGLDRVYPRKNLDLAHRIVAQGLLVSEYPLGTPPLAANFPKRNRIISGLSQGTLVVEAALASGSLITARMAAEQGREVFAIPGSIHAPQSRGCHALIRQGAKLVESAQDVLEELRLPTLVRCTELVGSQTVPADSAPEVDDPVLHALGFDPLGIDALVARTGMGAATLQVHLLELELDGRVARMPGGLFQRVDRA